MLFSKVKVRIKYVAKNKVLIDERISFIQSSIDEDKVCGINQCTDTVDRCFYSVK